MAIIPNFPQNLLDVHHHWHAPAEHPGTGPGRQHPFGTTGGGLEFLQFHRDYVAQFHAWYDIQPFGTAPFNAAPFLTQASAQTAVAGWPAIPAPVKNGAVTGWGSVQIAQEARLTTLSPPFASADDLGTYIEGGIHGWIHGATAAAFNEPAVGTFHSPLSTYFYGIHGLVDLWWTNWQNAQKSLIKDFIDTKQGAKEFKDNKEVVFEKLHPEKFHVEKHQPEKLHKEFLPEKQIKEKDKDKDIFEGGGFPGGGGDPPFNFGDLARRIGDLETMLSARSFIRPQERPMVGAVKPKK